MLLSLADICGEFNGLFFSRNSGKLEKLLTKLHFKSKYLSIKEEAMLHTFLLQPITWGVTGSYTSMGKTLLVTGKSTILHNEKTWIIDSFIQLENGVVLQTDYKVEPFKVSCASGAFTAASSILGELAGTFTIQDNKIIEVYHTKDQQFTGQEIMTMLDENHYTSIGTLYQHGTVKSTWSLNLTKIS